MRFFDLANPGFYQNRLRATCTFWSFITNIDPDSPPARMKSWRRTSRCFAQLVLRLTHIFGPAMRSREFSLSQRAALAIRPIYSFEDMRAIRRCIQEIRPDVIHLHNPFPLISPSVIRAAKSEGVPVVQTVHNFRHSCPAGDCFRGGQVCEDCSGKPLPWPAVLHGCYRGSRPQSAVMAVATRLHHATWLLVDHFLPVSEFVARHLVTSGIPSERVTVRPTSTERRGSVRPLGSDFVFVGRLDQGKGISLLISAWMESRVWQNHRLVVAGDGPERERIVAAQDHNVHYLGRVDRDRVSMLLDDAAVVVVPSVSYEGFPRVVAESFERGRPIAATTVGPLPELITRDVGWTAPPERVAFASMLSVAAANSRVQEKKGLAARAVYEFDVDTARNYDLAARSVRKAAGGPITPESTLKGVQKVRHS